MINSVGSLNDLVLESFGLPEMFPPELMPDRARQFVNDTRKGMPAAELIALAKTRGFRPLWRALPHMVEGAVFGLGLDVDGFQVPLMAKMTRLDLIGPPTADPDHAQEVDALQLALF